jgi:hypothetical protein
MSNPLAIALYGDVIRLFNEDCRPIESVSQSQPAFVHLASCFRFAGSRADFCTVCIWQRSLPTHQRRRWSWQRHARKQWHLRDFCYRLNPITLPAAHGCRLSSAFSRSKDLPKPKSSKIKICQPAFDLTTDAQRNLRAGELFRTHLPYWSLRASGHIYWCFVRQTRCRSCALWPSGMSTRFRDWLQQWAQ